MTADLHSMLLVDDDAVLRERLAKAFRERGFEVRTAGSYDEAVTLARVESPEYAIVDLRMPGKGGLELVKALHDVQLLPNDTLPYMRGHVHEELGLTTLRADLVQLQNHIESYECWRVQNEFSGLNKEVPHCLAKTPRTP